MTKPKKIRSKSTSSKTSVVATRMSKVLILHSGIAPHYFYSAGGTALLSPFDPTMHGVLWFPGIKYRVHVEVIGHEHKEWGCGPSLEEAKAWLTTDAAHYKKYPEKKEELEARIKDLEIVEEQKKLVDSYLKY